MLRFPKGSKIIKRTNKINPGFPQWKKVANKQPERKEDKLAC